LSLSVNIDSDIEQSSGNLESLWIGFNGRISLDNLSFLLLLVENESPAMHGLRPGQFIFLAVCSRKKVPWDPGIMGSCHGQNSSKVMPFVIWILFLKLA
jgi:hypothetical protein